MKLKETYCWQTCICCSSAPNVKLWHCAVTRQDMRLLPTASTLSLSSYFMFSGVYAFFIGFSCDVGRNVFSEWLEIESEHSVRCTKPSYKHVHSEVFSCPANSCDVRMLWIQCSEVHRSACPVQGLYAYAGSERTPPCASHHPSPNTEYVYF
jgi:hypothetical protein